MLKSLALTVAVFVPMLVEARRASRNERHQRSRGGIEPAGDVYGVMWWAYPLSFLAMLVEGGLRTDAGLPWTGAVVFAAAKMLKWWAIVTLGSCWTFRVIVVPGMTRITGGPYRLMEHPNYAAVVGELIGIAIATGSRVIGPLATIGFALLIRRRIGLEARALDAILRPAS
jgi:methyltransferase